MADFPGADEFVKTLQTANHTGNTCGNCKFGLEQIGPSRMMGPPGIEVLLCYREPPKVTSFITGRNPNNGQPTFTERTAYPPVAANERACGEWKPKIQLQ